MIGPTPQPTIFEEHAEVLPHWWAMGPASRTVLYFDAHLDLQPVDEAAMARLRQCRSREEVAALVHPHPLDPSPLPAYGIEDWLYPAKHLGLMNDLVWVVPPHVGIGFDRAALLQLCQTDGVTLADIDSIHRTPGGWLQATLLGVPMRICTHTQLKQLALPEDSCIVDVDIDYFLALPEDTPWITPSEITKTLRDLPVRLDHLSISRSVSSGFMAEGYARLADEMEESWQGDTPPHGPIQGHHPTHRARTDADTCEAILREACGIRHRRLATDLATVIRMQTRLDAMQDQRPQAGWCWAALGLLYVKFNRVDDAVACYRRSEAITGPHPELALAIGKLVVRLAKDKANVLAAREWLSHALNAPKWRTTALTYLSYVHMALGELNEALDAAEQAHARAPLWIDVLELKAAILGKLGQTTQARVVHEGLNAVQAQIAKTATRVSHPV